MVRRFNVTGSCDPKRHYMVDLTGRLEQIKTMIGYGDYFEIQRPGKYGKTTMLNALTEFIKEDYIVLSIDFTQIKEAAFTTEHTFSLTILECLQSAVKPVSGLDHELLDNAVKRAISDETFALDNMFRILNRMCYTAEKPVVLIIDGADNAINHEVFLELLAQLRGYYLKRAKCPTFQSVILAGVNDVRYIKFKFHALQHKRYSPWNIAADFNVDMSFNVKDIEGMLEEYEADHHTGMNTDQIAFEIYNYTSGHPFLVSKICKLLDERIAGSEKLHEITDVWSKEGIHAAVNILISEKNTLFDSLTGKLVKYPEFKEMVSSILFEEKDYPYVLTSHVIEMATMFGFICNEHNAVKITNRIFETVLYNHLLSEGITGN